MARREHHEEPEEPEGGMERWLLTYSDMITLLLALFVVLFALSTVNVQKFEALAASLKNTFSGHASVVKNSTGLLQHNSLVSRPGTVHALHSTPTSVAPVSGSSSSAASPPAGSQSLSTIQGELTAALASQGLAPDVSMSQVPASTAAPGALELVVQMLASKLFFQTDSAALGPIGNRVVDTIAGVLQRNTNNAVVEGFTDNEPIYGGPYSSNWELAAERAVHVVVRLVNVDGVARNRLAAISYGQTHPIVPNTTPAQRAENRRVDVVVLAPGETQP